MRKIKEAEVRYQKAQAEYEEARRKRDAAFTAFQQSDEKRRAQFEQENAEVRELQLGLGAGKHAAVLSYFQAVIDGSLNGEPDAVSAELGYSPDSKHLVADIELPDYSIIPEQTGFRYVKSADRVDPMLRPAAKRKALYLHLICQIALKCLDTVFRSGAPAAVVDCLTVNCMLETVDPATGQKAIVHLTEREQDVGYGQPPDHG